MSLNKKISAYALIYSLIISSIICLIASFIVLKLSQSRFLEMKMESRSNLIEIENSLLRLALSKAFNTKSHKEVFEYSLYENIKSSIKFENWGAYQLINIKSKSPFDSLNCPVFIGEEDYKYKHIALYISDKNQPLNISGNTEIIGNSYLPKKGIKKAIINGQTYLGNDLIEGHLYHSFENLPQINIPTLDKFIIHYEADQIKYSDYKDSINQSFSARPIQLYLGRNFYLDRHFYKGHIILSASESIKVSAKTFMEDVIIIAPKIEIESGCRMSAQLIAEQEIVISDNVRLIYPSLIYLNNKSEKGNIHIGENSNISGLILAQNAKPSEAEVLIKMKKGSQLNGLCYTDGIVELQGKINGSLICDNMQYSELGSHYLSYLVNASIDNNVLPKYFILPELFGELSEKKIMKWLY